MLRVLIADTQPLFAAGTRRVLTDTGSIDVVAEVADPGELARVLDNGPTPDVVVADAASWQSIVGSGGATPTVIVFYDSTAENDAITPLQEGAVMTVARAIAPAELVAAVRDVAGGRRRSAAGSR